MRQYPKKCPKCKEYMNPVFEDGIGRSHMGAELISNINQEPKGWKCECGYKTW